MANDMLKKYVAEKRTGANLVGIQVDTQNAYLLDRGTGPMMLNALEEIAKKADIARIENERQNLLLEAEETDLKFKKERLSDPLVYSDDEKYYGAMSDFNNLRKKKESLIAKSSFLTLEQKKQMIGRLKNNDELTLIGMMEKRNGVVIQKQVDDIIANTERKVAIAGQLSINDVGGKEQVVQDITDMTETLKNLVGWNDSQASLYVSKNIMAMEKSIFGNEINKIINSGFSLSEKKNKINNLLLVVNNEEILNKMAEQYASQIKFNVTDEEFKESVNYFKTKIKDVYNDVKASSYNQLESIEKQMNYENKLKKMEYDQEIENAIYNRNPYKLVYYGSNKKIKPTFEQMLNNENGVLQKFTDYSIADFGNLNNGIAFPFITSAINNDINDRINQKKRSGQYKNYSELYQPLYDIATELSGKDGLSSSKRRAIIIDYGLKNKIDPTILIQGETNPDFFRIGNLMGEGNKIANETGFVNQLASIKLSSKAQENFKKLSSEFSEDKILGNYLMTQYILGYAKVNNRIDRLLERPDIELNEILKNKNQMVVFNQDIQMAKKFTSQRIDYSYIKLEGPREKAKSLDKKIEQNKNTTENKKRSSLFGGRK